MQERSITRAVVLADIAMIGPAVIAVERDWGSILTPIEIMLLSAIVAVAFVAVEQLRQITRSEETQRNPLQTPAGPDNPTSPPPLLQNTSILISGVNRIHPLAGPAGYYFHPAWSAH